MSRPRTTSPRKNFAASRSIRTSRQSVLRNAAYPSAPCLEMLESRRLLSDAVHGLSATYVNGIMPGDYGVTRVDPNISFYWGSSSPADGINPDHFSVRWTGQIQPKYSETYTFITRSDEAERLWIDGKLVIDAWDRHSLRTDVSTPITLQAGKRYDIKMEYCDFVSTAVARLMWTSPSQPLEDVPESQLYAQGPFSDSPATTDQPIQAEDFDTGINSVAYKDVDSGNTGGAYRDSDVDIEPCGDAGGGYQIGYIRSGEWLEYSIDVPTTGKYSFDIRMGAKGSGGAMHAELDGADITGRMSVPNTGSWSAYQTVSTGGISIGAGHHILRLSSDVAGSSGYVGNYNWWQLRLQTQPLVSVTVNGTKVTSDQTLPVNFGTPTVGSLSQQTFVVTNQGTGTLDLGTPQLPDGFTLAEGLNSTLAPGASDSFTVRMDTSTATTHGGVIQFSTNDVLWNPVAFGVTGTVLAAPPLLPPPPPPPPTTGPVYLVPGTGFIGATAQPPVVGDTSIAGYDAKAIARWDVVPYQTFTDTFNVGVVAFHMNGIDHVSFSVNGGDWSNVYQPSLNPQTNVNEYFATLKASDFEDGQLEVRAIACPAKAGIPRVLQGSTIAANGENSIFLSSNSGGTLPSIAKYVSPTGSDTTGDGSASNPYATIMKAANAIQVAGGVGNADGGTVYLEKGDYKLGLYSYSLYTTTKDRWLTITPAPGVAKTDVRVTGSSDSNGIRTQLVHVRNVTVTGGLVADDVTLSPKLWLDGCQISGSGRTVSGDFSGGWSTTYATDSTASELMNGFAGALVRNCDVHNIGQIAYQNSGLLVNCTASYIDSSGTTFHPDVYQFFGNQGSGNVILYGLTAVQGIGAQGAFCGDNIALADAAMIDVTIANPLDGVLRTFSFGGATSNLYVKDSSFVGPYTYFAVSPDQHFTATDVVIENTFFSHDPGSIVGVTYR